MASIGRVLAGTSRTGGVPEEFEATSTLLADVAVASGDVNRLKAWWIFRMLRHARPPGRAADPDVARPLRDRRIEGR